MAIISGPPTVSVSSGSFTGAAQSLDVYGDFVAAYSGQIATDNSETTLLEYRSPAAIIVVTWDTAYLSTADPAGFTSDQYSFKLYFNDATIATMQHYDSSSATRGAGFPSFVIPAYTNVKVTAQNTTNGTANPCNTLMTGRIYRG